MAMLTPLDARRRWFGAFFLIFGFGMLIWGATLLNSFLMQRPILFMLYWCSCALFTGLALIYALLDMLIMRRRARQEQIELASRSLGDIEEAKKKRNVSENT